MANSIIENKSPRIFLPDKEKLCIENFNACIEVTRKIFWSCTDKYESE
jgi:hypothetical protein